MSFTVIDATEVVSKARIQLSGASGSGKTYSALAIAQGLGNGSVVVIDTENETSGKYAHKFKFKIIPFTKPYSPLRYVDAIEYAETLPQDVIIVDSITHAWAGTGGALEMVDNAARRYSGNRFAAWRDVTPDHNRLIDALLRCSKHLIVTVRSKQDHVMTQDAAGRTVVRKMGMAPIQREGLDYEFDIAGGLDIDHNWIIDKTRCDELDGQVFHKPGKEVGKVINSWLERGVDMMTYAEAKFMAKYGFHNWSDVQVIIGDMDKPTDNDGWQSIDILVAGMV